MVEAIRSVTSSRVSSGILARLMQAASPSSFDPAGAGGVLLGALLVCIGIGLLIGWAAGSAGIGTAAQDQAAEGAAMLGVPPARVLFAVQIGAGGAFPVDDVLPAYVPALVVIPALVAAGDAPAGKDRLRLR